MIVAEIHIPCCKVCHDWMRPVLAIEYPFQGCVWVCLNGCATLTEGNGDPPADPEAYLLSGLAQRLAGVS